MNDMIHVRNVARKILRYEQKENELGLSIKMTKSSTITEVQEIIATPAGTLISNQCLGSSIELCRGNIVNIDMARPQANKILMT